MKNRLIVVAILLALVTPALHADETPPQVHKQNGSTWVSGGRVEADRKALFKLAPKYPIQLIFQVGGEIEGVTGVKVTLRDQYGESMLEVVSEGPYLYINPPAGGRFTIDAEYNGDTQSQTKDLVGRRYLILEYKFTAN
ncbi:MAG TPA: hypothetical protein VIU02_01335 [Burkholderiales bacterium]